MVHPKNTPVAVVVPLHRRELTPEERVSQRAWHCCFERTQTHLVLPGRLSGSLHGEFPSATEVTFEDSWFSSRDTYSRLLLSIDFYRQFNQFSFILIYQLDSLAFSSDLPHWLAQNHDYVGAPWFRSNSKPKEGLLAVGNGGLSLRKVDAIFRVLESDIRPRYTYALAAHNWMPDLGKLPAVKRFQKALRVIRAARRGVKWYTSHYTLNEDKFWSFRARLFDPSFRVAPVEQALEFSFECFPRYCYELNGRRLPFGCHAWAKHDREFWEQFIGVPRDC